MKRRPKITYPCVWGYTVIGKDKAEIKKAIETTLSGKKYTVNISKKSSKGNYCSLRIALEVQTDQERNEVYNRLCKFPQIKIVL